MNIYLGKELKLTHPDGNIEIATIIHFEMLGENSANVLVKTRSSTEYCALLEKDDA